ncbi:DUF7288 family protein [Methanofollis ethanolicus]|uniref:DUF7288 family protein n=1 Tax=Methanofollis ethanolicus TaxID=488124 RepID=UPI000829DA61|nr:hypothetical protein [Methanofollis ethanolicus]
MVDDSAQLYTMEGIAAAFIVLATAYLVAGTTSVYTPGDSHITDMQLEVLGNDVLTVMDTPVKGTATESNLTRYIDMGNRSGFSTEFGSLLNAKNTGTDNLQFSANVSYRDGSDVKTTFFTRTQEMTGYEQAVRVARLVHMPENNTQTQPMGTREQVVMVEVLIWRG